MMDGEAVQGLGEQVAGVLPLDDVRRLRVQLAHVLVVEAQREALHLGELAARLQHNQDAHQAQQQVHWGSKHRPMPA